MAVKTPIYRIPRPPEQRSIVDVEEYVKRGQNGGVMVGRKKFLMLVYVDDLALVVKTEEKMKRGLKRFKVNVEKKKKS